MKQFRYLLFSLIIAMSSIHCTNKHVSQNKTKIKTLVFGVTLVNDTLKIKEYLDYHRNVWAEVEQAFKKAGYYSIEIYRFGTYLTMIVKIPENLTLDKINKDRVFENEKIREWNLIMSEYQVGLPGTKAGEKWVELNKIYDFKNE